MMTTIQTECLAEIRNAYISMCGVLRRVAKRNLSDAQGWVEMGKELRRQRDYFEMLRKEKENG